MLCFEFKVISISYFFDDCSFWELSDIVENLVYLDRNLWESQRLNAYITAQVNSTKKLQMKDICSFQWETKDEEKSDTSISDDEIKRLKENAKQWEKVISETREN